MSEKKIFEYYGPVYSAGKLIEECYEATVEAANKRKALNNLASQYKNFVKNAELRGITLDESKLIEVKQ